MCKIHSYIVSTTHQYFNISFNVCGRFGCGTKPAEVRMHHYKEMHSM